MEEKADVAGIFGGTTTVQVTALGRSKAAHEFLVLHYFGLDSAKRWDALLSEVLPAVRLPGASARRATALEMFKALPALSAWFLWLLVVMCGTGWASTPLDNL